MNAKKINIFLFCILFNFITYNTHSNSPCYLEFNLGADAIAYAVDPSNEKIAIAFLDGMVRIFNLISGKCILTLQVGKSFNYNLIFVPFLARQDIIDNEQMKEILESSSWAIIKDLFWHEDGRSIFVLIENLDQNGDNLKRNSFCEQWDIKTQKVLKSYDEEESDYYQPWYSHNVNKNKDRWINNFEPDIITIHRAEHSENGEKLPFATPDYQGKVWGTVITWDELKRINLSKPCSVFWSPDEQNLIVVKVDGIFLLNIKTELMTPFFLLNKEEEGASGKLWFSSNGKRIAVQVYNKNGACLDVFELNNARHIKRINNVYMQCFNLNGTKAICCEEKTGKIVIYDLS